MSAPKKRRRSAIHERSYIAGERAAWTGLLNHAARQLGGAPPRSLAGLLSEREAVISALRDLCAKWGDNEWDESDHLGDVLRKHLGDLLE